MQRRTRDLLLEQSEYGARRLSTRVIQGVRQPRGDDVCPRDVYDALQLVYPRLVFTDWSAAGLHGVEYAAGHPPEIWLPKQRTRAGVTIRTGALPPEDVADVLGRRATTPVRTAVDLARHQYGDQAIAAVEQCVRPDEIGRAVTTLDEIAQYLTSHRGLHNAVAVRHVLEEACVGAQSSWETFTRLAVHRSGLTMFRPQCPVPGTYLHADLGSPEYRIAIEYEGEYHRDSDQHKRDVQRWNRITDQKWDLVLVTAPMLTHAPAEFIALVVRKLRARGWEGAAPSTPVLHLYPETATKPQDRIAGTG